MLGMANEQSGVSVNLGGDGKGSGLEQWSDMERQPKDCSTRMNLLLWAKRRGFNTTVRVAGDLLGFLPCGRGSFGQRRSSLSPQVAGQRSLLCVGLASLALGLGCGTVGLSCGRARGLWKAARATSALQAAPDPGRAGYVWRWTCPSSATVCSGLA